MKSGEFSVWQFFDNGDQEQVRAFVGSQEAVRAAHHYCNSVGAKLGMTVRVIITDGGDFCVFEWKRGEGITFPPPEDFAALRAGKEAQDADGQ